MNVNSNSKNTLVTISSIAGVIYHLKKENGQINLYSENKDKLSKDKKKFLVKNLNKFEENLDKLNYLSISTNSQAVFGFGENFYTGSSPDGFLWELQDTLDKNIVSGYIVPYYKLDNKEVLYWSDNEIHIGLKEKRAWTLFDDPIYSQNFKAGPLHLLSVFNQKDGIFVPFATEIDIEGIKHFSLSVAIFDKADPRKIKWRFSYPIWNLPMELTDEIKSPISILEINNKIYSYWRGEDKVFKFRHPLLEQIIFDYPKNLAAHLIKKADNNPILSPDSQSPWESIGAFNPAALYDDEEKKLHLMYRAVGSNWRSTMGYAASSDGVNIDSKSPSPCYVPRASFEGEAIPFNPNSPFTSGPGAGGCEDPRLTKIDGKVYLTYVAYDGWNGPRVALSHIPYNDFKNNNWNWSDPVIISKPGVIDKNAVIFPEKINGKYVIMHRVFPDILVDFVDSLSFDGNTFLEGKNKITPSKNGWDSRKIGAGPPPIRTKYGWLLIYHGVDDKKSHQYQAGAMLLDHKNPLKVLARTTQPILSPTHWYENEGFKSGVVYPCGAAVIGGNLHIYYGGSDTYVCVATAPFNLFLDYLKNEKETKFNYYHLN